MIDIVTQVLLYLSAILALVGSIGLIRFPDFYTRTHAATVVSIGSFSLVIFALFIFTFWSVFTLKLIIIMIFNLFTNPTATHAIADTAYKLGIKPKKLVKNEMVK